MAVSAGAGIGFELSPEQRELRELAHEFAERELRPIAREWDEREDCPADLLAQGGGARAHLPRDPGRVRRGRRVARSPRRSSREELSWGCAGLSAPIGATMFPVRPLLFAASEEQRQRWLPRLASEEGCLAAIAFTEPGAGSDVAGIQATARRDGDEYVLNGEKCYITNGGIAELTLVFAKLDGAVTAFMLEAGDPGVGTGRKELKLGLARVPHGLDPARRRAHPGRPARRRGGAGPRDRAGLLHALAPAGRRLGGRDRARSVRIRDRVRERAPRVRQAADREAGRVVQAGRDGDGDRGGTAAHVACRRGPGRRGGRGSCVGSYAKGFAADTAMRATTEAVQVLGGAGIMRDHPVEKWMRDAKVMQIVEGTSEIQRHVVVQYLRRGVTQASQSPPARPLHSEPWGSMPLPCAPKRCAVVLRASSRAGSSCPRRSSPSSPRSSGSRSRARRPGSPKESRSQGSTSAG